MPVRPRYADPFSSVMIASPISEVSDEQKELIQKVLHIACADSSFAEKAYRAIVRILTAGSVVVPVVEDLEPGSVTVGDPSFVLHVIGTGFTNKSVIIFNGGEEPTVFVSPTELTTGVNMDTVSGPSVVPVGVLSEDGILSNVQDFVFQEA